MRACVLCGFDSESRGVCVRSFLGRVLLGAWWSRGDGGAAARAPRRPAGASSEFLSRGVCWRGVCFACARFRGGRAAGSVWAGGGASVAGPRGRVALPRAPASALSNQVRFWPKPRAERPRAARQAVGVELWTLSTCGGAVMAAILSFSPQSGRRALSSFKLYALLHSVRGPLDSK